MSLAVDILLANPPPGTCPTNFADLVTQLRTLLTGSIPNTFSPYIIGASTPTADQQGYVWFKLDGSGRPLGVYTYYNGNWRRVYNGRFQEIAWFDGDPNGVFDSTGKGLLATDWDGWALCNGNNGTRNMTDKFIVTGHMDGSGAVDGYATGGWQTKVTGAALKTGGVKDITLTSGNTYREAVPEIKVGKWAADGNNARTGGNMLGDISTPGVSLVLQAAIAGNNTPPAIPTVPPFNVLAPVKFIGYT